MARSKKTAKRKKTVKRKKTTTTTTKENKSTNRRTTSSNRRYLPGKCPTCAAPECKLKACILAPFCTRHTKEAFGVSLRKVPLAGHKNKTVGLFNASKTLEKGTYLDLPYSGTPHKKEKSRKKGVRQDPEIDKIMRRTKFIAYDSANNKYINASDVRNYPGRFIRFAGKLEKPNLLLDVTKGFTTAKHNNIVGYRYKLKVLTAIGTDDEMLMVPFTRAQLIVLGRHFVRKRGTKSTNAATSKVKKMSRKKATTTTYSLALGGKKKKKKKTKTKTKTKKKIVGEKGKSSTSTSLNRHQILATKRLKARKRLNEARAARKRINAARAARKRINDRKTINNRKRLTVRKKK